MGTSTITIAIEEGTEHLIEARASTRDQSVEQYVRSLIVKDILNSPTWDEVVTPIRQGFAESGLSEDELLAIIEQEREALWKELHPEGPA